MLSDPYDIILTMARQVETLSLKNIRADGVARYGHLDLRALAQQPKENMLPV